MWSEELHSRMGMKFISVLTTRRKINYYCFPKEISTPLKNFTSIQVNGIMYLTSKSK